ncbi:hypothetical protein SEA_DAUDAU_73 [Streptomyces phage Daudau]|uniref:Uncharacterized protein n=1 Tax=Streptomyces phage Daudau TaxID=2041206 RepID=A0A291LIB4_9CAUD|nr:hypothetical protein KGG88_gp73 [Streptomyces phage Daudau]ATI18774.1 hypothetical protein SEA_DAUDAU_73 [Streptomyces phage Daudau]
MAVVSRAWAHLHLPRLKSGVRDVISLKVPGERIEYVSATGLNDVEFKVHEHGRKRAIFENRRNVHAWVVGELKWQMTGVTLYTLAGGMRKAVYDPWKGGTFVDAETLEPVLRAEGAVLIGKDVYYQ